jgi:S-adenosylmethionine:tRNA ribosyltransferase-isomerase
MRLSDFDFELPPDRIAQRPAARRDAARLLVEHLPDGPRRDRTFGDIVDELCPGDLLVLNDVRVRPARLHAARPTGGRVELLLVERVPGDAPRYLAMARPAAKLRPGMELTLEGREATRFSVRCIERPVGPDGEPEPHWLVELSGEEEALLASCGELPLPPYIERDHGPDADDAERYQTVYARAGLAVAAPTAGLHFTPELLATLEARGVRRASLTLDVGPGTFRPVQHEDLDAHPMHAETYELPPETVAAVRATRAAGGRVIACGTTTVRALESAARFDDLEPGRRTTRLFLKPGERFHVVDGMITNFHLPKSTLLMLVAAFAGIERMRSAYAHAIEQGYRFYSYGDASLWLRGAGL